MSAHVRNPGNPTIRRAALALLEAGPLGLTSLGLQQAARAVNLSALVTELRRNGYPVTCRREPNQGTTKRFRYSLTGRGLRAVVDGRVVGARP